LPGPAGGPQAGCLGRTRPNMQAGLRLSAAGATCRSPRRKLERAVEAGAAPIRRSMDYWRLLVPAASGRRAGRRPNIAPRWCWRPRDPGPAQQLRRIPLRRGDASTEGVARFQEAARNQLYRTPWVGPTPMAGVCLHSAPARRRRPEPLYVARVAGAGPTTPRAAMQLVELLLAQNSRPGRRFIGDASAIFSSATPPTARAGCCWAGARRAGPVESVQTRAQIGMGGCRRSFPDSDQARSRSCGHPPPRN